jgi:ABC-type microcin C transport system duplicated ATPase subunit YejF
VKDLRVTFKTPDGDVTAVNDLNFNLRRVKRWASSANPVPVNRKPPLR